MAQTEEGAKKVAKILDNMTQTEEGATKAAKILENMTLTKAAYILEYYMTPTKAVKILECMMPTKAANILDNMRILNVMDIVIYMAQTEEGAK